MERLVAIVDQGTERQPEQVQPDFPGDSRFSQLCLRKLYVLCSRGAEASAPQGGLLQVQRPPPFLLPYPTAKTSACITTWLAKFLSFEEGQASHYVEGLCTEANHQEEDMLDRHSLSSSRLSNES